MSGPGAMRFRSNATWNVGVSVDVCDNMLGAPSLSNVLLSLRKLVKCGFVEYRLVENPRGYKGHAYKEYKVVD